MPVPTQSRSRYRGLRRLLHDHDVGVARADDLDERVFATGSAAADVVRQEAQRHSRVGFSMSV